MVTRPALAGIFLAAFTLYLVNLHPAFPVDDSPETIAACVNLGIQHAPGYPLLTLLGKLATLIPVGSVMFRVNLLAAMVGAGCCSLLAFAVARWTPSRAPLLAGLAAAGALATSRVFWECSLSAKGAMYLLNLVLVVCSCLSASEAGAALGLGLAFANHWMSAIWWVPGLLLAGRKSPHRARRLALNVALAMLGESLYLQLPLCARHEPAWGEPVTPVGFLSVVLRRDFLPQAALKPAAIGLEQFVYALLSPMRDGGVVFVLLALLGLTWLIRLNRRGLGTWLGGSLLLLAATSALANPIHIPSGEPFFWMMDRFFLPWVAIFAAGCGAGCALLTTRLPRPWNRSGWVAAAALPLGLLAINGFRNDHARDYLGYDYARNICGGLSRPTTILSEADYQCFPLFTYLDVEAQDPGVDLIITNPFLNRTWGWKRLGIRHPEFADLAHDPRSYTDRILALTDRLGAQGGLYHLSLCSYPALRQRLRYDGIRSTVLPAPPPRLPPAPPDVSRLFQRYRLRGLYSPSPYKDEAATSVLDIYCLALGHTGDAEAAAGRLPSAIDGWRRGLTIFGRTGHAMLWTSIGNAAGRLGRYAEAEDAFRRAAQLKPHDVDLWANIATACAAQGKTEEALRWFDWVLDRQPGHRAALANRALLLRRLGG